MARAICIIQGHPHAGGGHFCHALADAYGAGAREAGHTVEVIDLGAMDIPILRDPAEFLKPPPDAIQAAQAVVLRSNHLVIIYPLWLGTMPALVKAFFEQLAREEFAIGASEQGWPRKMLKGRSARVVVTMGMPATAYRVFFRAHGVRGFESGVLGMAGIAPVRETLIGGGGVASEAGRRGWLRRLGAMGRRGD